MKTNRAVLAVILTLALFLGSTAPVPAESNDLERAEQEALNFIESHLSFVPQWMNAKVGDAIQLTDLDGGDIGYAFPIFSVDKEAGRIMIGSSSTSWSFMEAGTANLPSRPTLAEVEKAITNLGVSHVSVHTALRTVYLGAPSILVDIYDVDGLKVGVDWRNDRAWLISDLASSLAPSFAPKQQTGLLSSPEYAKFELPVPIRNMSDVPDSWKIIAAQPLEQWLANSTTVTETIQTSRIGTMTLSRCLTTWKRVSIGLEARCQPT